MTPEILSLIKDSVAVKFFDNGRVACVQERTFGRAVLITDALLDLKACQWLYSSLAAALEAMDNWDGEGNPR